MGNRGSMKLRSRSSDPSDKGKSVMELLDYEDDDHSSSDSDYSESSHEGFDNGEDLAVEDSEVDEPKRRKIGSRREKRKNQEREEKSDEEMVVEFDHVEPVVKDIAIVEKRKNKKVKKTRPTLMWEVWEEETEKWLDEHMTTDIDLDNLNEVVVETADASPDLIMPLLRYQKEWLAWALKQEESASRGGILADEMGMGKTVQAIALVLAKRALWREIGEPVGLSTGSSTGLPCVKATLVICPLIAAMQWVNEINRFTAKGSNKVLVYHGANRAKTLCEFSQYDFIITTYSIVEAEYRKNVMPPKDRCQWCGKMFYEKKLQIHLKYFCGPDAIKTDKQSKQYKKGGKHAEKLSLSKEDPSADEDDKKKAKDKKAKRQRKKEKLGTGGSSDSPSGSSYKSSQKSILHSVKWTRIILDEAHYIKDRRCNTTRAVFALESSYKWALSGTPLQNRVGELYSLVRFLQVTPFSHYMCKDCDCKVLDSPNSVCQDCPHKSVRHFCWWNRYIANPIANGGRSDKGRRAMILLKDKVLKSILLRRTKKGRAADLALPPRIISLRRDYLDITEKDYYTSLYSESQAQFNTYIEAGTLMNNYAHIFDLLTHLRQAVDHPYLVVYSKSAVERRAGEAKSTEEQICGLCHDVAEDPVVTSCGHLFCKPCLIEFSASYGQPACPSCSKPLTVDFSSNKDQEDQKPKMSVKGFKSTSIINRIRLEDFQTSTKIDALKEEIRFMVERDGSAKGIVFSQFTSFLDLISYSLQKCGVKCVQLDGSMSMGAREAAITKFTEDGECRVFLMSLKAGGVALNLTVASHVFLMDPWWNPAVEQQAQDRIHRIGQYKPIRVVRFIIENTIEERILNLQEKKKLVFEGTVGGSSEALGRLTEADMRFLFAT